MKKRMYKIMALAMTAAMVVPMAAQTTAFAADDKEITYWNIAVESPDKDIVTAAVDKFNKETESGYTVNQVSIQNDTYKEKLVIAMSSGECPDMYSSWSGGPMYEYIDSGFAQPIDDLLDQSDIKDKLLDAAIERIAALLIDGIRSGSAIFQKYCPLVAPSILAASNTSYGMFV